MNIKGKKIDFSKQELFIGIDVHKKSWTVTIRIPSTVLKTYSMRPSSKELKKHMEKYYPHGNYHSVYDPPRRTDFLVSGFIANSQSWVLIIS